MKLTQEQRELLKKLMANSARKGNLANSGLVLENGKTIASDESLVVSNHDATAHSERMLVEKVGGLKGSNFTPGLTMITVVEPCIMCISACSQAGYEKIGYIIPASKYIAQIPWMSDTAKIDKYDLASKLSSPVQLVHLKEYEDEFCDVFEDAMAHLLSPDISANY